VPIQHRNMDAQGIWTHSIGKLSILRIQSLLMRGVSPLYSDSKRARKGNPREHRSIETLSDTLLGADRRGTPP